jgi:hypothetical protein
MPVFSCVQVAAMRRADNSSKKSYRLCRKDYETEEESRAQQRAVEPQIDRFIYIHLEIIRKSWEISDMVAGKSIEYRSRYLSNSN